VFAIWTLYVPSLSVVELSTKLGRSYARIGAHFLLVLSSTVAIVACTWMAKTSFAELGAIRDDGSWTTLPLSGVALAILWMTLMRDGRMSPPAIIHLLSFVVLFTLALLSIPASISQSYWLLLGGVGVLMLEAVLALVLTRRTL
jgi:uncharacterized membrane protein